MDNLTTKKLLDKHQRPVKSGEENTSLELAIEGYGAKIKGDLEITGELKTLSSSPEFSSAGDLDITAQGDLTLVGYGGGGVTLSSAGNIALNATNGEIAFKSTVYIGEINNDGDYTNFVLYEDGGHSVNDYFKVACGREGITTIKTVDGSGTDAHLILDADGDIRLDSTTGTFPLKNNGTQFIPDMYAGMMLGCTHVFGSGTTGVFVTTTAAWENLLWDTDKFALVTFVLPPSNIVKISVQLPWILAGSNEIRLGLTEGDDADSSSLGTKYENDVDDANRSDSFSMNYSWVVEGSDHSWSAGQTKTLYIMAYTGGTVRFYTGGTNTSSFGGVIVEATALPATIGDGSEP